MELSVLPLVGLPKGNSRIRRDRFLLRVSRAFLRESRDGKGNPGSAQHGGLDARTMRWLGIARGELAVS